MTFDRAMSLSLIHVAGTLVVFGLAGVVRVAADTVRAAWPRVRRRLRRLFNGGPAYAAIRLDAWRARRRRRAERLAIRRGMLWTAAAIREGRLTDRGCADRPDR